VGKLPFRLVVYLHSSDPFANISNSFESKSYSTIQPNTMPTLVGKDVGATGFGLMGMSISFGLEASPVYSNIITDTPR
jgi:hypothetical protein